MATPLLDKAMQAIAAALDGPFLKEVSVPLDKSSAEKPTITRKAWLNKSDKVEQMKQAKLYINSIADFSTLANDSDLLDLVDIACRHGKFYLEPARSAAFALDVTFAARSAEEEEKQAALREKEAEEARVREEERKEADRERRARQTVVIIGPPPAEREEQLQMAIKKIELLAREKKSLYSDPGLLDLRWKVVRDLAAGVKKTKTMEAFLKAFETKEEGKPKKKHKH